MTAFTQLRLGLALFLSLLLPLLFTLVRAYDGSDSEDEDLESDTLSSTGLLPKGNPGRFVRKLEDVVKKNPFSAYIESLTLDDIKLELAVIAGLLLYCFVHFVGRRRNTFIAKAWVKATLPIWKRNFVQVGTDDKHKLVRDGPSDFIFYATGRYYVKDVYGWIKLRPRNDLIFLATNFFSSPSASSSQDTVTLHFNISAPNIDNFIFAILPRNKANAIVKQRYDLFEYTKSRESSEIPPKYSFYSDNAEFQAMLLADPSVRRALWKSTGVLNEDDRKLNNGTPPSTKGGYKLPLIESLILTDQPKVKPTKVDQIRNTPKTLTVDLRFPPYDPTSPEFEEALASVVTLVIDIIDYIGQCGKLSATTREKLDRIRDASVAKIMREAEEERKEELQAKKIQDKRARAEAATKLSPEEQRKFEEKERKREAKKAQSKMMKRGKLVMR